MSKFKTLANSTWTVKPLLRPDLDDDPMGIYVIEPAARSLTKRYFAAEPETSELAAVHADNAAIARLLQAAPKLLAACQMVVDRWEKGDLAAAARACDAAIAEAMAS